MSGPKTDTTGQIVKHVDNAATMRGLVQRMTGEFARALPKHMTAERMARVVMTAITKTPQLADCTQSSFAGAILTAAQLGLEPNTPLGECYLIPYRNKKLGIVECQLIPGYQGLMTLARRSGDIAGIVARSVRQGDFFEYELGLDEKLRHVPTDDPERESRPITHVYAIGKTKSGDRTFEVLSIAQVEARRLRSSSQFKGSPPSGPWATDYEAMAKKTAIRQIFRWLPKSTELARAEAIEVASERGQPLPIDIDDTTNNALAAKGIVIEALPSATTDDGASYDPSTGEVSPEEEERMMQAVRS